MLFPKIPPRESEVRLKKKDDLINNLKKLVLEVPGVYYHSQSRSDMSIFKPNIVNINFFLFPWCHYPALHVTLRVKIAAECRKWCLFISVIQTLFSWSVDSARNRISAS